MCSRGTWASVKVVFSQLPSPASLSTNPKPWNIVQLRVLLSHRGEVFRKEAGGGNPALGEVEPPEHFRALPPQGPPSFGCTRLGLAPEVRPPSGDCSFIPRGQTGQVQWVLSFRHQLLSSLRPRTVQPWVSRLLGVQAWDLSLGSQRHQQNPVDFPFSVPNECFFCSGP